MNRKQLTILIVVGIVLGGLGWLAWQKQQTPFKESMTQVGEQLFPNFPINDVDRVTIRVSTNELNLLRKEDIWTIAERGNYPANWNNIGDFLRKIYDLKVAKPVKISAARLGPLQLLPAEKGGTVVEFKDKNGKVLKSLTLGAQHKREAGNDSPFGGGSWPDGRYVMVGTNSQTVALVQEPFSNVDAKPEDWLNKDWFKVEKLKSISVVTTNATNNWKIARESESGEWKLVDAKPGESIDTSKSGGVTTAFSYPSFNDIVTNASPAVTGLDKPTVTATLETFDGHVYTAKVGNKVGDDTYYFQIATAGNFSKERTPGKDEKPEDKEKLDKEFKEKGAKSEEKLKNEKAYEKWTYIVSKWTVEPLLKERKDLLAEKKEEPKKEEPKKEEPKKEEPKKQEPPAPPAPPPIETKTDPKSGPQPDSKQ
jgi:hypothetical protein